jgi:nucleotide-binding universal stress UspA family protein
MKSLLCPVDFSDTSHNAIAYAAKLAKASGATITLLNVRSSLKSLALFNSGQKSITQAVSEKLKEISREVSQVFKISCDSEVLETSDRLSKAISNKAPGFDMIVMGTNGVEDPFDFLKGSNAYNTILSSKIPVLLVPSYCMYSEIKNIVYAYSYVREHKLPLTQLLSWINVLKSDVTILQVNEEAVSRDVIEEMNEWQFILTQHWMKQDINLSFDSIRSPEIAPSINSYMHRTQSDVLALCISREYFIKGLFNKSVLKVISEIADYPVFVFHE